MSLDLDKIKKRLLNVQNKEKSSENWFRPEEGEKYSIRIIPVEDGDPFSEYWLHYNVGRSLPFVCPQKQRRENCPVCDFASKLYREGDEESQRLAKKLFPKGRYYSPVMVRGKESEGVKWWGYSRTTYETLLKLMVNEEYGDITDLENGTDLVLEYSKPAGKLFPETNLQPKRKTSRLCEDMEEDECLEMLNNVKKIVDLLSIKTTSEVQQILNESLNLQGEEVSKGEVEKYGAEESSTKKSSNKKKTIDEAFTDLMTEDE